jgi:hypothetical protein
MDGALIRVLERVKSAVLREQTSPRTHQLRFLRWAILREQHVVLGVRGGANFMEMGTGKTLSMILLICVTRCLRRFDYLSPADWPALHAITRGLFPTTTTTTAATTTTTTKTTPATLVVGSQAVIDVWHTELERFAKVRRSGTSNSTPAEGLLIRTIRSTDTRILDDLQHSDVAPDIVFITSNLLESIHRTGPRHPLHGVLNVGWHRIIAEEVHTFTASSSGVLDALLATRAWTRWCLTGTPVGNDARQFLRAFCTLGVDTTVFLDTSRRESFDSIPLQRAAAICADLCSHLAFWRRRGSPGDFQSAQEANPAALMNLLIGLYPTVAKQDPCREYIREMVRSPPDWATLAAHVSARVSSSASANPRLVQDLLDSGAIYPTTTTTTPDLPLLVAITRMRLAWLSDLWGAGLNTAFAHWNHATPSPTAPTSSTQAITIHVVSYRVERDPLAAEVSDDIEWHLCTAINHVALAPPSAEDHQSAAAIGFSLSATMKAAALHPDLALYSRGKYDILDIIRRSPDLAEHYDVLARYRARHGLVHIRKEQSEGDGDHGAKNNKKKQKKAAEQQQQQSPARALHVLGSILRDPRIKDRARALDNITRKEKRESQAAPRFDSAADHARRDRFLVFEQSYTRCISRRMRLFEQYLTTCVASDEKVVVFDSSAEALRVYEAFTREVLRIPTLLVTADTASRDERGSLFARFQNEDGPDSPRILFVTLALGSVAFNMTRASHVVFLYSEFDPGKLGQACARITRPGQTRVPRFILLTADGFAGSNDMSRVSLMQLKGRASSAITGNSAFAVQFVPVESVDRLSPSSSSNSGTAAPRGPAWNVSPVHMRERHAEIQSQLSQVAVAPMTRPHTDDEGPINVPGIGYIYMTM